MGMLTAKRVHALKTPGRYGDGGTLFLVVEKPPKKSRHWVQRLTIDGVRRDIGLGGYPFVSLSAARETAAENRRVARRGGDPRATMRPSKVPTFRTACERSASTTWTTKTAESRAAALERYAYPALGDRRVDQIGREDVLRVLTPIWAGKPALARRIRGWIRTALEWAQGHGYVDLNVASEAINGALPKTAAVRAHHPALPYTEVGAALTAIADSGAGATVKACLQFIALTAVRSSEAREAQWPEIDLEAREWRVPADRMKMGVEHRVPLSGPAVAILDAMKPYSDADGYVFPGTRPAKPIERATLPAALSRIYGKRATVHGFRSSFRTWAAERSSQTRDVIEMALAHKVGSDVERSYARTDLFEKRRALMDQWGHYVTGDSAKVLAFR